MIERLERLETVRRSLSTTPRASRRFSIIDRKSNGENRNNKHPWPIIARCIFDFRAQPIPIPDDRFRPRREPQRSIDRSIAAVIWSREIRLQDRIDDDFKSAFEPAYLSDYSLPPPFVPTASETEIRSKELIKIDKKFESLSRTSRQAIGLDSRQSARFQE